MTYIFGGLRMSFVIYFETNAMAQCNFVVENQRGPIRNGRAKGGETLNCSQGEFLFI
jgi:hypothetical protein